MFRGRIAAVSYLNTVPFIYGIEHADDLRATLLLSPPSGCAAAYNDSLADIALLPVGALPTLKNARIITPYCIGASGAVRTVTVMSNRPLNDVRTVWLDSHSMTSALLVRILCRHHWKIEPQFRRMEDYTVAETPAEGDAFLFIGDKVFDYEGRFAHVWDLAVCWEQMTGLPFVFAVWVARDGVDDHVVRRLEEALEYGTRHVREAIARYGHSGKPYAYSYLTQNIDYLFDERKHEALSLYWELGRTFLPKADPG